MVKLSAAAEPQATAKTAPANRPDHNFLLIFILLLIGLLLRPPVPQCEPPATPRYRRTVSRPSSKCHSCPMPFLLYLLSPLLFQLRAAAVGAISLPRVRPIAG